MCVRALHACGVWNLADMKTLGTVHSSYTHVVACLRTYVRLSVLLLLLSFSCLVKVACLVQVGKPCGPTML